MATDHDLKDQSSIKYIPTFSIHIDDYVYEPKTSDVIAISIVNDYDELNVPVVKLEAALPQEIVEKMTLARDKAYVRLKLKSSTMVTGSKQAKSANVFNKIFKIYIDDIRPYIEKATNTTSKNKSSLNMSSDNEGDSISKNDNIVKLFLFTSDVNKNSKILNVVLSKASMTDAVGVVLGKAGFSKILMEPLSNTTEYSDVLLPPYTTIGNLKYLQNQYGLYKTGFMYFAGLDRAYLLSKSGKCKAYEKGEYKKVAITVSNADDGNSVTANSYADDKGKTYHLMVSPYNMDMKSYSIVNNGINGNKKELVNPKNGGSTKITEGETNGTANLEVLVNRYANKYADEELTNSLQENDVELQFTVTDVDIKAMTPNKQFVVKFEDSKTNKLYGATYRLLKTVTTLVRTDEEEHSVNMQFTLRK